jgi:hypothetical protein
MGELTWKLHLRVHGKIRVPSHFSYFQL